MNEDSYHLNKIAEIESELFFNKATYENKKLSVNH